MLIDTVELFNQVKPILLGCLDPAVDTETNGLNPWGSSGKEPHRIIGISVDVGSNAYYFPYRHLVGDNLPMETMQFFRDYLSNPDRVIGGFNYKFDMHMLFADGVPYASNIEDAMLSAHLLNENEESFRLKELGDKYLSGTASSEESILLDKIRVSGGGKGDMNRLPPSDVEPYACDDVRLTRALLDMHKPALKYWDLYDIWKQINFYECITAHVENRGMLLDLPELDRLSEEAHIHSKGALEKLNEIAGYALNPNSSKQVCALLGVDSSAAEILEVMSEKDDNAGRAARAVSLARGWLSVGSRYYDVYRRSCDKEGVIRASLKLHGTISGRLSCTDPNMQAVARTTEVFKVKDVFISRPGFTMISMDYKQAEMRLASFYAKEETMANILRAGEDVHGSTANMLNIPRDAAKRINFGVIYGIGADALSEQLRIKKPLAKEYLTKYHTLYPGFRRLMNACEATAEKDGNIRMWTGRMRHYNGQNTPTHKAMSNLVQGGVAEIMRVAISKMFPPIRDMHGYLLMQVHDQVIFEVPDEEVQTAILVVKGVMEDFTFDPLMLVDIKYGKRWGRMEKWQG